MKHIALRSMSVRNNSNPYTTPGLGDRAHSVLMAYQYGKAHNTPVTLHLTSDKFGKPHKKVSWKELSEMTDGFVQYQDWPVCKLSEKEWLKYLKDKGVDAEIYHYKDTMHMHQFEEADGIEISQYFKELPCMEPIDCSADLNLPEKFVTVQWDSTDAGRRPSPILAHKLEQDCKDAGYEIVVIGGQAKNDLLRDSLKHIGYAISKANHHLGVDSGMIHVAQFYKPWSKIHIWKPKFISHHFVRAKNNGAVILQ